MKDKKLNKIDNNLFEVLMLFLTLEKYTREFMFSRNSYFTSQDFRDKRNGVFYDYLPRAIFDLKKIKLPSGKYLEFETKENYKGRLKGYRIEPNYLTKEDIEFLKNKKNVKVPKILSKKQRAKDIILQEIKTLEENFYDGETAFKRQLILGKIEGLNKALEIIGLKGVK